MKKLGLIAISGFIGYKLCEKLIGYGLEIAMQNNPKLEKELLKGLKKSRSNRRKGSK